MVKNERKMGKGKKHKRNGNEGMSNRGKGEKIKVKPEEAVNVALKGQKEEDVSI